MSICLRKTSASFSTNTYYDKVSGSALFLPCLQARVLTKLSI